MIALLSLLLLGSDASAFLLVHPQYRLRDPEKVTVNIAAGGCQSNGVSNDELKAAIIRSIDKYWNTVTESRLKLKAGDEVGNTLGGGADPGQIIVGCSALGAGIAGVTYPDIGEGSAIVALNSTIFVPGGYSTEDMIGTLTHELGHAIGLNHSGDPASVMTYEAHDWGPAPGYLAQDDKDGVVYLYGNEPTLGGVLGSCSAIAHDGRPRSKVNPWFFFGELFVLIGAAQLARLIRFAYSKI